MEQIFKRVLAVLLTGVILFSLAACKKEDSTSNLINNEKEERKTVNLFSPMEKSNPNAKNIARTAHEVTILEAEERLDLRVEYKTYTATNHQEKTYDDVTIDRARNNMDDLYLLNPDTIQILGSEGWLADLSSLDCADNLREVVKTANTVDGKLVAIPQEVVVNGLFINKDMFDKYELELPDKTKNLLL